MICSKGAYIRPVRTYEGAGALAKRQSEPTTDEDQDAEWAGTISNGTPSQNFLIDFDSTYAPTWRVPRMLSESYSGFVGPLGPRGELL